MGRDPDSKWVHWLASSRRNNPSSPGSPGSTFGTSSSSASSNIVRSRSSATSYFALLSASEDGLSDSRSLANHRQHRNPSGFTTRGMDSSWAAWYTERYQRQLADMPELAMQGRSHSSDQSFFNINLGLPPSEAHQLQMQRISLPQDLENQVTSNTAPTAASAVGSSVGTTSSLPSPLNNFLDSDIDSLGTFPDLLSNFCSPPPFDSINTQASGAAGPYATAGLDDEDLSWLEEQHAFALNLGDESGRSSPSGKRIREGYPGDYASDTQLPAENITKKKQKTFHPWNDRHETSSPYSSNKLRPNR